MKNKIRKGIALFLSGVLCVAACVTTIPQLSLTAYAAGTGKDLQLTAGVFPVPRQAVCILVRTSRAVVGQADIIPIP